MKVCIPNARHTFENPSTGKGFFIKRLAAEFEALGVETTACFWDKADILLGVGKWPKNLSKTKCRKKVLRLGAVHLDTQQRWKKLNQRKKDALKTADGVIFQSVFSMNCCDAFLGKPTCPTEIIFNGADPRLYASIEPFSSCKKYNIVAATRVWTEQKRLSSIVQAFEMAAIPNCKLFILGNLNGMRYTAPNAFHIGLQDEIETARVLKKADVLVHPVWLDACPNIVAEALCAGCTVVHTNEGGTREMVVEAGGGVMLLNDPPYDYKPVNLSKPPKMNVEKLAEAMKTALVRPNPGKPKSRLSHVHIVNVANQYLDFFERILGA